MILITALLWVSLLNIGKLIKDRIQMQIAADTAVMSANAYRARALNIAGVLNDWLGTPGVGIGTPFSSWWPTPGHRMGKDVVKQTINDFKDSFGKAKRYMSGDQREQVTGVLEFLLQGLLKMVLLAYDTHPKAEPVYALKQKDFIESVIRVQEDYVKSYGGGKAFEKAREVARLQGADDIYTPKGSFTLGLQRNKGPIWYLGTLHLWFVKNPKFPILIAPWFPINENDDPTKRWYEQGPHFNRKSMRLYAFRRPSSKWNGTFPLGRNVLNIQMPYLYSVAAGRVYNPDGPMFPRASTSNSFTAGMSASTEYKHARNGWRSQLTPVGGLYAH